MQNVNIIEELNKFNHIKYFDEPHKYFDGEREFVSATTFIGKFKPKFDTETIAEDYAKRRGLNVDDVISDWDYKRDRSTIKGTLVHDYAENFWMNKVFPYDGREAIKRFGTDSVEEAFKKCKNIFHKFYEDASKNLLPIKMEWVIGDKDFNVAGMIDGLFYNKKSNCLEIYDYKTNKEIKVKNDFNQTFSNPIDHLDICEINTYSLQLSLYKYIIEKNTNLKIGNCYLVWINEVNSSYKVFTCKDLLAEIKLMIEHVKK